VRTRAPLAAALILAAGFRGADARPRPPAEAAALVLVSPTGEERTVMASDFTFVYFERVYYTRHAPRSEDPAGRRIDVQDRRRECRCLRLEDLSEVSFRKLRQIEISYSPDGRTARIRLTYRRGEIREHPAETLGGGLSPFAPRFAATVDGVHHEFLLRADEESGGPPGERLARVLLALPKAPRRR
jgi:hypothetical protein